MKIEKRNPQNPVTYLAENLPLPWVDVAGLELGLEIVTKLIGWSDDEDPDQEISLKPTPYPYRILLIERSDRYHLRSIQIGLDVYERGEALPPIKPGESVRFRVKKRGKLQGPQTIKMHFAMPRAI